MRRRLTQLELVGALLGLLEVAKVPFAKERASDETPASVREAEPPQGEAGPGEARAKMRR